MAFAGWGDAAEASTTAISTLVAAWSAQSFATIDPEEFYDFTQTRPRVYLDESMAREVEWPVATFSYRRRPEATNDVVVFRAFEPQLRWRQYSTGIFDFFERLHVSSVVTLGSLLADVPHTRPAQLTGFATTEDLRARLNGLGIALSQYQGPTGMVGVLHDAARQRNIPSLSIWAAAPHYIAAAANPKVALALLEALGSVMDWTLDLATLRKEGREFEAEVDSIMGRNPEAAAYVKRLEERSPAETSQALFPLPSNESLMRELEDFLRRGREKPRGDA